MIRKLWATLDPRSSRATHMSELRNWLRSLGGGGGVILEKDEDTGIALLRLDQPTKKNAITGSMMVDLETAVETLQAWSAGKAVLLYGAGHNFCSGGDLSFVRRIANPTDGHKMAVFMQTVLTRLQTLPLLSVALIEGAGALGGGAELALACDWRLMTQNTRGIGYVHCHMGIAPAWGGAARLVDAVGYSTALDLMTTGRLVSGLEATQLGLAHGLVGSEDPVSEAMAWLQQRTHGAPQVVQAIKTLASNARETGLSAAMESERDIFAPLWGGPTNLEALSKHIKHRL